MKVVSWRLSAASNGIWPFTAVFNTIGFYVV